MSLKICSLCVQISDANTEGDGAEWRLRYIHIHIHSIYIYIYHTCMCTHRHVSSGVTHFSFSEMLNEVLPSGLRRGGPTLQLASKLGTE